jgi:hypothetical protein
LTKIKESIEIEAPANRVWDIISDLDNESEYWWGTKEVKNFSKEGNVIDREIYQNFRRHGIKQKVILKPKTEIEIQYLKGLTQGVKFLRLESEGENRQKLVALWNIHFSGIYWFATPFIRNHVRKGTRDALRRIKDVSEGRPIKYPEENKTQTASDLV